MKVHGGVWCQTVAPTTLVTHMMTTVVIDESTDSFIILTDVYLFVIHQTTWQVIEKYISSSMRSSIKVRRV